MTDIVSITKEVIELFEKHDLSKVQCVFVVEAVKMGITEEMMKEIIEDAKKGHDSIPGVG